MPVKKIEVERALRNELKESRERPLVNPDFRQGFLAGMKQAIVVVSKVRGTHG